MSVVSRSCRSSCSMGESVHEYESSTTPQGAHTCVWPVRLTAPGEGTAGVEALIRQLNPRRILDIATGSGSVLKWLREVHPSCPCLVGIDVAAGHLKAALKTLADTRVALLAMDAARVGLCDSSVDMVIIAHSLHHLPDVAGALREARRVLVPGGWLVVAEMHRDDALPSQAVHIDMHGWWAEIDTAVGISHRPVYRRGDILAFVAALGMEDVDVAEDPGDETRARDPELLQVYGARFGTYAEKARLCERYAALSARGQELKARMMEIGCAPPRVIVVTARKPHAV